MHHLPKLSVCVRCILCDISPIVTIIVPPGFHIVGEWMGVELKSNLKVGKCCFKTLCIVLRRPCL